MNSKNTVLTKKPDKRDHVLCDSIYTKYAEKARSRFIVALWLGGWGEMDAGQ